MRISDWSSDVCSSDLDGTARNGLQRGDELRTRDDAVGGEVGRSGVSSLAADADVEPVGRRHCRAATDSEGARILAGKVVHAPDGLAGKPVEQPFLDHGPRSEEHTSELQSLMRISYTVFCLQ